jgi:hypothetical protein
VRESQHRGVVGIYLLAFREHERHHAVVGARLQLLEDAAEVLDGRLAQGGEQGRNWAGRS